MRRSMIILNIALVILNARGQDYLVSFAGSGDTNRVAVVRVDNLVSGATVSMDGSDTLHLVPAVGIQSKDMEVQPLHLCPNPATDHTLLSFAVPTAGNTIISIADLSGKTVCLIKHPVSAGMNRFRLSGISRGIYLVNVMGEGFCHSAKLASLLMEPGKPCIDFISTAGHSGSILKNATAMITMPYVDGDQLLFRGSSGIYTTIIADVPSGDKTIIFDFAACIDADNHHYSVTHIGSQSWMAENLNAGTRIDVVTNQTNNGILEKYCYNDDEQNCTLYGGLYQWNEMMQYVTVPGVQGICPSGWHIPRDAEWCTLTLYLDPTVFCQAMGWTGTDAGGKLKQTGTMEAGTGYFHAPNTGATNSSGFTGLPAGCRGDNGSFEYLGLYGYWWTSTPGGSPVWAWSWSPDYNASSIVRGYNQTVGGYSLRCVEN